LPAACRNSAGVFAIVGQLIAKGWKSTTLTEGQPMCEVTIQGENGAFLTIALRGRSHPGATDFWDVNWVTATATFQAGGFRGTAGGHVRAEELAAFHNQLASMQETLRGTAEFTTVERWLHIRVEGDGRGHLECRCVIRDGPSFANTLECTLATDQTFTRSTL